MKHNAYKKSLAVLVFSFCAVTGAFAQFTAGAELGIPMGTFGDGYGTGFGISGSYQKPINDNLSWTAYAGYQSFSGKSGTYVSGVSFSMIPIQGGIKYYFTESGNGFYGELDLGIFFATASGGGASASDSKFGFTPAVGYRVSSFDLGLRYNLIENANNLSFRVAYVFGGDN